MEKMITKGTDEMPTATTTTSTMFKAPSWTRRLLPGTKAPSQSMHSDVIAKGERNPCKSEKNLGLLQIWVHPYLQGSRKDTVYSDVDG